MKLCKLLVYTNLKLFLCFCIAMSFELSFGTQKTCWWTRSIWWLGKHALIFMLRGMSFDIFTKFYANKLEMFQLSSFCMWKCHHNIINFFTEYMVLTDDWWYSNSTYLRELAIHFAKSFFLFNSLKRKEKNGSFHWFQGYCSIEIYSESAAIILRINPSV